MGPTPWGTHVITRGEPWLGQTLEELRTAFSDYDLIADLGCGCCLNIPVRDHGQTIGTLNLLDAQGRYGTDHLHRAIKFGDPCVPLLKTAGKLWKIASNHRETLYE
jgi:chemotaxis receptor (MCP) glutamine deamidase CheD